MNMNFESLGLNFLVGEKRPNKSEQHTTLQAIPIIFFSGFPKQLMIESEFTNADTWIESGLRDVLRVVLGQHECVLVPTVIKMDA